MVAERVRLSGWGGTVPSVARVDRVRSADVHDLVTRVHPRGVLARGLGRSYNDAAQNGGGHVVELIREEMPALTGSGLVSIDAAVTLDELLKLIVPHGWFVPVTPGTRFVTVGGAVACDVHGKNHHVAGTIGAHVSQIELVLADGSRNTLDREAPLFWATIGGMGLTGVISRVWLQLIPIRSASMAVKTVVTDSLENTFETLDSDESASYSVAWLDTMATGSRLGRGVVSFGRHADDSEVGAQAPAHYSPRQTFGVPGVLRWNLLSEPVVRAFNHAWYNRAKIRQGESVESIAGFFHPLDGVANWNRLYGKAGFVQHQMVVPDRERESIRDALGVLSSGGHPSFLSVLKRLGKEGGGLLSFPMDGWTLAVDLPNRGPVTGRLLDQLDEIALRADGRVYLAKDSNLTAERFACMYPRLEEWLDIREDVDPGRHFQSDLARRLQL